MLCKKIKELLKADYLDAEAGAQEAQEVIEHLALCPSCRKLQEDLQAQRAAFQKVKQVEPPEQVWQNIRAAIEAEELKENERAGAGILGWLQRQIFAPRPVFVLSGAVTAVILVLFFATTLIQKQQISRSQSMAEETILLYEVNGPGTGPLIDLGTNVEEYFL